MSSSITQEQRDQVVREIVEDIAGKGYRDPVGRDASVHLVVTWLGGVEGERPGGRDGWDDVAPNVEDMESTGRL